jgi:hypothetical protein
MRMMTFGPNDTKVPGVEQEYSSEDSLGTYMHVPTTITNRAPTKAARANHW